MKQNETIQGLEGNFQDLIRWGGYQKYIIWSSIYRMGMNMPKLCGTHPQLQQLIAQANTMTSQATHNRPVKSTEMITPKPIFHKISPIRFSHINVESETLLPLEDANNRSRCKNKPQSAEGKEGEFELLSLQEILIEEEKKFQFSRIGVNWHSFIKIKKKNYLEDYAFIKQLGKGAYGCVLKVKMKYGGLLRAAKVLKSSLVTKSKTKCEKLFAEIAVPIRLDHPNLVKLYEVFQYNKQYVLIMELCQGGDLFQNIRKSRFFSEGKAGHIIRQILAAVNYMHKRKVVHRDLKPENILMDHESQTLKIADFGTAVFYSDKKLKDFVGTAYYMAPEVIAGTYDEKCDVWSCGVILYILLCGSPPFNGHTEKQIMERIQYKPLQFKNPIWSKRNKQVKELISKMLNKNPAERITAEEALNNEWIANLPDVKTLSKQKINSMQIEVIKNLQSFHFKNKLKAVVYTYIASQLYSNKDKDNLLRVFRQIDKDGDGVIERNQLINIFNTHSESSLTETEVEKILSLVDTNGSGQIDFTEFLVAASNEEKLLEEQRLENAFNYLDADHSGFITIEEVKAFLDKSDETSDEIKQIFDEVDINGDGQISKREFVSLLLKRD